MITRYPKRLIEVDLPIKRISAHARREKSIRHGHISTLHIWWSRKPLAVCRATACSSLWPDPVDENCPQKFRERALKIIIDFAKKVTSDSTLGQEHCSPDIWVKWNVLAKQEKRLDPKNTAHLNILRFALLDFIADFANWDNSNVKEYIEASCELSQVAHEALGGEKGTRALVVDPFAGGGSIPLEALRVGANVYASDLNPVAVIINKVILEFIPKYGNKLAKELVKWSREVRDKAFEKLSIYYPKDSDGEIPVAYLWARTIQCQGPRCGITVPIIQSGQLVKNAKRKLRISIQANRNDWKFVITKDDKPGGTVKRGSVTCPCCGYTTPVEDVRRQLKQKHGGTDDAIILAVVLENKGKTGRAYRLGQPKDLKIFENAKKKIEELKLSHGKDILPSHELPLMSGVFNVPIYGMDTWETCFTPRQRLFLYTLSEIIKSISNDNLLNNPLREPIITCLSLALDKCADFNSALTAWISVGEKIGHTFGRQALGMIWDYSETVPFVDFSGSWDRCVEYIVKVIEQNEVIKNTSATIEQCPVQDHVLPDDSADLIRAC